MLGGQSRDGGRGYDDINLEADQFGRKSGEPIELPVCRSVFDHEVAALDVTVVTQSLHEGHLGDAPLAGHQVAYASDLGCLLGVGCPRRGKDAGQRAEECPPIGHGMTSD